jgi:hypothetical protein
MSEILDAIKAISDPCVKLIEAVRAGIGKAYEPRHVKKMADAKAHEIMVIGQAMRENMDVPINYDKGALTMDTEDIDEFVKRTEKRMAYQELVKQKNIEAVVDEAYALLEDEDEPASEEPIDNDWILRFFNSVQDVSNEDMQKLWAKVLAGEVKRPKSFSMRTLETLHNLSKDEATIFNKLCSYFICISGTVFIPSHSEYLKENGIDFSNILLMGECGLVNTNPNLVLQKPILARDTGITVMDGVLLAASTKSGEEQKLLIGQYPLTRSGRELWEIIDVSASKDVFLSFAKIIKKDSPRFSVSAFCVSGEADGIIQHEQKDLLEENAD